MKRKPHLGRVRVALAALLSGVLLAGCAHIPTNSEVFSQEISVPDLGNIFYQAAGPRVGANPREIVNGFVSAQIAAVTDNLSTAREFLTAEASRNWNPNTDTTVYSGDLNLDIDAPEAAEAAEQDPALTELNHVTIAANAKSLGTVDSAGTYTESLADAAYEATFELIRNSNGEWRISGLRDGLVLAQPLFESNFRSIAVYFLSPDERYLVPDVRWVWKARAETYAMLALLNGPSSWLSDSVHNAIPDGTRLLYDSVSLENGTALVNLSREIYSASSAERSKLATQIHTTLLRIPGVRSVTIQADSVDMTAEVDTSIVRDPNRASGAAANPVGYTSGQLFSIKGKDLEPVGGVASLEEFDVTALAIPEVIVGGVFRDGMDTIRRLPSSVRNAETESDSQSGADPEAGTETDADAQAQAQAGTDENEESGSGESPASNDSDAKDAPEPALPAQAPVLISGNSLVAPSIDPYGWVWSGETWQNAKSGELLLSARTGTIQTTVPVSWLAGRQVLTVKASHDGTRLAVVSSVNGVAHVEVAGIVRDTLNTPLNLSDPVSVGGQITGATAVQWLDEANLWVIGHTANNDTETLFSVPVSGRSDAIAPAENTETLTAGRGLRAVVLGTDEGIIRTRGSTGASWSDNSIGVRFPTLPG